MVFLHDNHRILAPIIMCCFLTKLTISMRKNFERFGKLMSFQGHSQMLMTVFVTNIFLSPTSASHTGHFQIKTLVLYSNEILNLGSSNSYSMEYDFLVSYFAFYHSFCGWLMGYLFVVPVLFVSQFFL